MSLKKYIPLFKKQQTPFWFYDVALLEKTLAAVKKAAGLYSFEVHYALKANSNDPILKKICSAGLGADCVSGNEVKKAIECGFKPDRIVFAGVGKSDREIDFALSKNIFCFNCESAEEIRVINVLARKRKKVARIALRINPNVNAHTHHYITTGLEENKFGINLWELEEVLSAIKASKSIALTGIHFHIGSQITSLEPFRSLCLKVNEIQEWFASNRILLKEINVGGGLGVNYHEPDKENICDYATFFKLFHDFIELRPGQRLHFELGRALVAQCGSLVSKVLYVKKGVNTNFAILDAGMTELIRPALYQSYHKIENLSKLGKDDTTRYDVVGPICESSDCFGKSVLLPETKRGDLFALRTTGAYGEVMSSQYNLRTKAKAIYK